MQWHHPCYRENNSWPVSVAQTTPSELVRATDLSAARDSAWAKREETDTEETGRKTNTEKRNWRFGMPREYWAARVMLLLQYEVQLLGSSGSGGAFDGATASL